MELFESRRTKFLRAFFLLFPALLLVLSCTLFVAGVSSTSDQAVHKEQDALEQALKNMKEKGQDICYLYPYSIPYYRRKGWEIISDKISYEIKDYQLPKLR